MGLISKLTGHRQEQTAKQWLSKKGIKCIAQNFRCPRGEIDLIGLSSKPEPTLIFVEVKYRKNNHYGSPAETLSVSQQQRIFKCAQGFLAANPTYQTHSIRFDLIAITENQPIEWIQDAFQVQ